MKLKTLISFLFALVLLRAFAVVDLEVGLEGLTIPTRVDTPVLGKPTSFLENDKPVAIPEPATSNVPANPEETDLTKHQHLGITADKRSDKIPEKASFPRTIGEGEVASLEQKGRGTSEYEVIADGNTELQVYLPTYKPAKVIARLIDVDGEEIYFKGNSLLLWERPDDKAFAPVFFKGDSDEKSMKQASANNFDAVQNVYKFEVKKGQKIRLEITGLPEPSSYARAKGPLDSSR